ncbi:HEAT repeat domain-containing protein [Paraflavitalea sp. CAU 1676]|uniref:HEAT repeat domain-containing protein n=1 Tax=Paraflavitalea sp. CAU 1676 TaxID=3032598 RepID=UPI0023DBB3D7|nr:HEAT repeat domain-containing protein [Paraflavitalea sp. CAU 1676]MDF2188588.1 HEAT repeat domain-containing protein [Paraflavitalea sp. CAU 1676]
MAFYDLSRQERAGVVAAIKADITAELTRGTPAKTGAYFAHEDTYIRKAAYLSVGRIYFEQEALQPNVIERLNALLQHSDFKVRQTVINAAGEIGKQDFAVVQHFFDQGLLDAHHSPRNAVIGSVKKMGEVNPVPVLQWARQYLHHEDKEIRREICHGIELRGRKHPLDIMPLLKELQHDKTARVRNTLVHVIGQIAYKTGCLEQVVQELNHWENKQLVADALEEIIDVHHRYCDFAALTQDQAREYIAKHSCRQ